MIEFVLASTNRHKVIEFTNALEQVKDVLGEYRLLTPEDIGFTDDIIEDGESFEENAMIKASSVAEHGYITFSDDSGLSVDALGGAPGIYSARYSGGHGDHAANNRLLLENMADIADRAAHYVCAIACVFPKTAERFVVRGECHGEILRQPRGDGGFGYDPLFYYPPLGKTFSELSLEEKNTISHRRVALDKFVIELLKRIKGEAYADK